MGNDATKGKRIVTKDGWVDFENSSEWQRPTMDMYSGTRIHFSNNQLREKLKAFVETDRVYYLAGVVAHPLAVDFLPHYATVENFQVRKKRKSDDENICSYSPYFFNSVLVAFDELLKKENISFERFTSLDAHSYAHIPTRMSWPEQYIIPFAQRKDFLETIKNNTSLVERMLTIDAQKPSHRSAQVKLLHKYDIPLLKKDSLSNTLPGSAIQTAINFFMPHRLNYTRSTFNGDDDNL